MQRFWLGATAVLGLLTGCDRGRYTVVPEYGVWDTAPYGWVDGTTMDANTPEAVPHIQLQLAGQTTRSDERGYFYFEGATDCEEPCVLEAQDIDGPSNGSYQDASIELTSNQVYELEVELQPVE